MHPKVNLSSGAISVLAAGNADVKPVVQLTDLRQVSGAGPERYRVMLSDGVDAQQGMLDAQLNTLVHSNQLRKGSVVQLTHFTCNKVQNRMITVIINLNVILDICDQIGDPKIYQSYQPEKDEISFLATYNADVKPVVQLLDIRLVSTMTTSATERYRVMLSDGLHTQQGMLDVQLNGLVHSNKLRKLSIVQLTKFTCNKIQHRTIANIIDLNVILEICDQIVDPKLYQTKIDGVH